MADCSRYIATGSPGATSTVPPRPDGHWRPLNPRQSEALSRSEFELFIGGARGGGKSEVGMMLLLDPAYASNPNYRCLVLRKNATDLHDWVHRFKNFAPAFIPGIELSGNPPTIKFPMGGMGTLGHMASRDSWEHYLGHEYAKILIEELNLLDESSYLMLLGSCRTTDPTMPTQIISSGNPGGKGHAWVKKRFVDCCRDKPYIDKASGLTRIFIPLFLAENSALPKEYTDTLRLLPETIQKGWIYGDWNALAGQMFIQMPALIEPHEITEPCLYGSFDFGSSTTGHSSFGMWHIRPDHVPERLCTWYHKLSHTAGAQALELANYVKSFSYTKGKLPRKVFADPSIFAKRKEIALDQTPKSVADYFNEAFGADPNDPIFVPANNNRANGWVVVQDYFGVHPITREPKCLVWEGYNQTLFDHFELQIRNPDNPDDITPNDFDHVCDEVRYGLVAIRSLNPEPDVEPAPQEFPYADSYEPNYSETAWMA